MRPSNIEGGTPGIEKNIRSVDIPLEEGRQNILETLLKKYDEFIIKFATKRAHELGILDTQSDAHHDIAQNVRLKALRFLEDFRGISEAEFRTWLGDIVATECLMYQRTGQRYDHHIKKFTRVVSSDNESGIDTHTPEIATGTSEHAHILQEAIEHAVSDVYQETFKRYVIDGIKGEDIAEEMGVPVTTIWSRIKKSRHQIKKYLTEKYGPNIVEEIIGR